jgi:hypothetical protein
MDDAAADGRCGGRPAGQVSGDERATSRIATASDKTLARLELEEDENGGQRRREEPGGRRTRPSAEGTL